MFQRVADMIDLDENIQIADADYARTPENIACFL